MKDEQGSVRIVYIRPMVIAGFFAFAGLAILVFFHEFSPDSGIRIGDRLLSAALGAAFMAVAIGAMTGFVVGNRYKGAIAAVLSAFCYAMVWIAGILIGFELDMKFDLFESDESPLSYILAVTIPALLTAPLYGWLLHSGLGRDLLARLGL